MKEPDVRAWLAQLREGEIPGSPPPPPPIDDQPEGDDDDPMEERLRNLESDVQVVKATMATRENVAMLDATLRTAINEQTWKLILAVFGWATAAVGACFLIARYVHP